MNVPNFLTLLRVVMTIMIICVFHNDMVVAAMLFVLASITDYFDGYLSRKYGLITSFGKIMDPVADKFLILSAFGLFVYIQVMPWWMFWVIAIREVIVTVFRFAAMAKGKVLAAERSGKAKTVLQIATICFMFIFQIFSIRLGGSFFEIPASLFLAAGVVALLYLSVIITLLSGISAVWNNRFIFFKEDRW